MSKYAKYRFKGWQNNLMTQPFGIATNPNHTYDGYFNTRAKMLQFPVLVRPEEFQPLLDKSIKTREPQPELTAKLAQMIYDETTLFLQRSWPISQASRSKR